MFMRKNRSYEQEPIPNPYSSTNSIAPPCSNKDGRDHNHYLKVGQPTENHNEQGPYKDLYPMKHGHSRIRIRSTCPTPTLVNTLNYVIFFFKFLVVLACPCRVGVGYRHVSQTRTHLI